MLSYYSQTWVNLHSNQTVWHLLLKSNFSITHNIHILQEETFPQSEIDNNLGLFMRKQIGPLNPAFTSSQSKATLKRACQTQCFYRWMNISIVALMWLWPNMNVRGDCSCKKNYCTVIHLKRWEMSTAEPLSVNAVCKIPDLPVNTHI